MFYVGALLPIYSTPPFKIHPTAMGNRFNFVNINKPCRKKAKSSHLKKLSAFKFNQLIAAENNSLPVKLLTNVNFDGRKVL